MGGDRILIRLIRGESRDWRSSTYPIKSDGGQSLDCRVVSRRDGLRFGGNEPSLKRRGLGSRFEERIHCSRRCIYERPHVSVPELYWKELQESGDHVKQKA